MKKQVLSLTAAMAVSSFAVAGSYQAEVDGHLASVDVDNGDNATLLGVMGTYYFAPVDTQGKPLAEAAFLNKASDVYASITSLNSDSGDITTTSLGAEVYIPNSIVYLGLDYTNVDYDYGDDSHWSLTGGVTPIAGLRITTTYVEDDGYDFNVAAKYVTQLGGGQSVSFNGSFVDNDTNSYTAGFDFYFTRATSVGLQLADSGPNTTYTLQGKHFFTETAFVGAYYTSSDASDTIGVVGGLRF